MTPNITIRTHFNPCFWTAIWNDDYFELVKSGCEKEMKARDIKVQSLNIFSNEIHPKKTNNLFVEKKLGLIEYDTKEYLKLLEKYFPEEYNNIDSNQENANYILDFEDLFSAMEANPAYKTLLEIGCGKSIENEEEQANLALFVILHSLRNHVFINSVLECHKMVDKSKLEFFLNLKWILQDVEFLQKQVVNYLEGAWTIYDSQFHLPLTDSPITNKNGLLFCVLSPDRLLVIDNQKRNGELNYRSEISSQLFNQVNSRLISNTYREVAFRTKEQAEEWKNSKLWEYRRKLILNKKK